jgi:enoyl-CoA hydratase/long-chain 3-hydroxyacyl-CoA dehydrogenase
MHNAQNIPAQIKLQLPSLTLKVSGEVGIVVFDQEGKKVNTLNSSLIPQFDQIIQQIKSSLSIKVVVIISGKSDCFIAGADIAELLATQDSEEAQLLSQNGQRFLSQLSELSQPVIAAIHGSCLGGGLELALACDWRIATESDKTSFGLPEVLLGLLPGAGGTQRLPRRVGLANALTMMLSGSPVNARKAYAMGLVDYLTYAENLEEFSLKVARRVLAEPGVLKRPKKQNLMSLLEKIPIARDYMLKQARAQVDKKTKGLYPAPAAIIETVGFGLKEGLASGQAKESAEFAKLAQTSHFRSLASLYFAQTDLKKNRFGTPNRRVKEIGVLGAGLMGAGISAVSIQRDFQVRLKDLSQDNLGKGKKYIWDILRQKIARKRLSAFSADQIFSRIFAQTDYRNFHQCGVVVEAVFEDLALKQKMLADLEALCPEDFVFATNTSAIPISKIAAGCKRPHNVVGMHYFSPVPQMPLLEVIVTKETAPQAAALAVDVGIRQGKTVIVVHDGPGFYTTRILAPFMDEAAQVCREGVSPQQLDTLMQEFGYPVGPITLIDEVGIDVAFHVGKEMGEELGPRVSSGDSALLQELMAQKSLGKKSGKGFYLYNGKKPNLLQKLGLQKKPKGKTPNPHALELLQKHKLSATTSSSPEDIKKRLCYRMLNEAVYCLQEGILERPLDGDVGAVFGLGFPPFLGGPFRYIDTVGAKKIVEDLQRFAEFRGEAFRPCPLLEEHARNGSRFYP